MSVTGLGPSSWSVGSPLSSGNGGGLARSWEDDVPVTRIEYEEGAEDLLSAAGVLSRAHSRPSPASPSKSPPPSIGRHHSLSVAPALSRPPPTLPSPTTPNDSLHPIRSRAYSTISQTPSSASSASSSAATSARKPRARAPPRPRPGQVDTGGGMWGYAAPPPPPSYSSSSYPPPPRPKPTRSERLKSEAEAEAARVRTKAEEERRVRELVRDELERFALREEADRLAGGLTGLRQHSHSKLRSAPSAEWDGCSSSSGSNRRPSTAAGAPSAWRAVSPPPTPPLSPDYDPLARRLSVAVGQGAEVAGLKQLPTPSNSAESEAAAADVGVGGPAAGEKERGKVKKKGWLKKLLGKGGESASAGVGAGARGQDRDD